MVTLRNVQGGSLVAPLGDILLEGIRPVQERKREETRISDLGQRIQGILGGEPSTDTQRAGAGADQGILGQLSPQMAQAVNQARGNPEQAAGLRTQAQTGVDLATELQGLPDHAARIRRLRQEGGVAAGKGEDMSRIVDLINLDPDRLDLELQKMQLIGNETLSQLPPAQPQVSDLAAVIASNPQLGTVLLGRQDRQVKEAQARRDRAAAVARAARAPKGPLAQGLAEIQGNLDRGQITPEDAELRRARLRAETTVAPPPAFSGEVPEGMMLADPANPRLGVIPIPGAPAGGGAEGFAIDTEILPGGATIQATSTGDIIVKDPEGNIVEGQARLDVLEASQETETNLARQISGEKEAGKVAIQVSREAFDTLGIVNKNLENLQRAVTLLEEGGKITGPVTQLLPNVSANAVALENLRSTLALDVVGATRFGALSKGELDLAKDVALPTGLRPAALQEHLQARIAAQQKYGAYLAEAATFLGIPGNTVSDFVIQQSEAQQVRESAAPVAVPVSTAELATTPTPEFINSMSAAAAAAGVTVQQMWDIATPQERAGR